MCDSERCTRTANSGEVIYGIPGNWIGRAPANGVNAVEPMVDVAPCQTKADVHAVAFNKRPREIREGGPVSDALRSSDYKDGQCVREGMQVRRLTPTECERLQGFPDGYTDIMPKGKPTPDGPRYKALGNSMACNVMHWIGERIQMVEEI